MVGSTTPRGSGEIRPAGLKPEQGINPDHPQYPCHRVDDKVHHSLVVGDENPAEDVCGLWAREEKRKSADYQAIHAYMQDSNNNIRLTWTDKDEHFPLDKST